jgi:hypothetical protein
VVSEVLVGRNAIDLAVLSIAPSTCPNIKVHDVGHLQLRSACFNLASTSLTRHTASLLVKMQLEPNVGDGLKGSQMLPHHVQPLQMHSSALSDLNPQPLDRRCYDTPRLGISPISFFGCPPWVYDAFHLIFTELPDPR